MAQLSKEIIEFATSASLEEYKLFIETVSSDEVCKEAFMDALARQFDSLEINDILDKCLEYENEDDDDDDDDDEDEDEDD